MELYSFTDGTMRVKSDHIVTLLPGFHRIVEESSDSNLIHSFVLLSKLKESVSDNIFYAWYNIKDYSLTVDKVSILSKKFEDTENTNSIVFVTMAENGTFDNTTISEHINLFEEWRANISYSINNIRQYNGLLYRVINAHTSQIGWEPDKAVSLWVQIADPSEEWPEWSQPIGAHDAYDIDAKVSHNNKHWISNVSNNIWEPGVYGWTESEVS